MASQRGINPAIPNEGVELFGSQTLVLAEVTAKAAEMTRQAAEKTRELAADAFEARKQQIIEEERLAAEAAAMAAKAAESATEAERAMAENEDHRRLFEARHQRAPRQARRNNANKKEERTRHTTKTCVYCLKTYTRTDECRRHIREKELPKRFPHLDRAGKIRQANIDAP